MPACASAPSQSPGAQLKYQWKISFFSHFLKDRPVTHTQAILGIPLLTRWRHGNGRVWAGEVVTGLLLHRVFLVAFFFFNWVWWQLQERGGVKNCILSDIDSLNGLKTRMVKFTSSRQYPINISFLIQEPSIFNALIKGPFIQKYIFKYFLMFLHEYQAKRKSTWSHKNTLTDNYSQIFNIYKQL